MSASTGLPYLRGFLSLCIALTVALTVVACGSIPQPTSDPITSTLSAIDRADQAEAKVNLLAVTRGQMAYYLQKSKFSSTISELGIGVSETSDAYKLAMNTQGTQVVITATSLKPSLKSYAAIVVVNPSGTMFTRTCETISAGQPPISPVNQGGNPQCADGSAPVAD